MKITLFILLIAALSLASAPTLAATVNVKFENPDKYSDIDYYSGSRKKFRERLFKNLTDYIDEEANKILSDSYQLDLNFTNIDLAGRYDFTGNDQIRIVRDIDFPRLKFSFQLTKDGKIIEDAEVYLKDMGFLRHIQSGTRQTVGSFYHEKQLLRKWFLKEIKPLIK